MDVSGSQFFFFIALSSLVRVLEGAQVGVSPDANGRSKAKSGGTPLLPQVAATCPGETGWLGVRGT